MDSSDDGTHTQVSIEKDRDSVSIDSYLEENMPPFEAGVEGSGTVKKVAFDDMPLLINQESGETVRYTSPVHNTPFLEPEHLVVHTKDVVDPTVGPGKAGLFNLGNTCFMNSGLQSLFSSSSLVKFFLNEHSLNKSNEDTLTGMFTKLVYKVWSGQYAIIHPLDFKTTLGMYHPQFQDYRQHDCQEFLALLLDTLHEQLNGTLGQYSAAVNSFPGPSSSSYDPLLYSACLPSSTCEPEASSSTESCPANNKVSSASYLAGKIKKSPANITMKINREMQDSDTTIGGSVESVRSIENLRQKTVTSFTNQSQGSPNGDSNLSNISCQSSDSEQSVGLSRLKLRDLTKELTVLSSTDPTSNDPAIIDNSGLFSANIDMLSASHSLTDQTPGGSIIISGVKTENETESSTPFAGADQGLSNKSMTVTSSDGSNLQSLSEVFSALPSSTSLESIDEKGCTSVLNNTIPRARLPTLEELYSKDSKTLNTNVLVTEYMDEDIQMDSEKFAKVDNLNRSQESLENPDVNVNELALSTTVKKDKPAPRLVKDTNIQADNLKKGRMAKNDTSSQGVSEGDSTLENSTSINNAKRMKFEGMEKNMKRQALRKVNQEKQLLFHKSDVGMIQSDPDSCSSDDEAMNESLVEMGDEGQSSVSRNSPVELSVTPPDVERITPANIAAANKEWEDYVEKNRSVVVDTFQGQFRSTVICSECNHISVTYEPFMYLSVPLPHAMERQISVIFVSCDQLPPVRYLFTMHKSDNVLKLKRELREVATVPDMNMCDIVMAEVLDCHLSRILDDSVMLGYVNDTSRVIYAFKMLPPPSPLCFLDMEDDEMELIDQSTDNAHISSNQERPFEVRSGPSSSSAATATCTLSNPAEQDIFSNVGLFNATQVPCTSTSMSRDDLQCPDIAQRIMEENMQLDEAFPPGSRILDYGDGVINDSLRSPRSMMNTPELDMTGVKAWGGEAAIDSTTASMGDDCLLGTWTMDSTVEFSPPPRLPGVSSSSTSTGVADQWRSCAICLEEMVDGDLMVHASCGGTLCQNCLEMSFKHYGDIAYCCPVCSISVNPYESFLPLAGGTGKNSKSRILAVPVAYRLEADSAPEMFHLFGHPNIIYLHSRMRGQSVYDVIDQIIPFISNYSVSLTDGQGLHCSRCVYTEHCTGCLVIRESEVSLQPGDHLTITISDLSHGQIELAHKFHDHKSMEKLRLKDPITIFDCFGAFTESEILDEHNPWYCPQCCQNQRAKKTITVWRYPDTLIIHLKRFVFHELSSTKIDNKVVFPLDNLDLSDFLSGPRTKELVYDLHSIVCHFGGANAGHYTAYSKHPLLGQWYYNNDETVAAREPRDDDHSSAYILFYQRHGTGVQFTPLSKQQVADDLEPSSSTCSDFSSCVSMAHTQSIEVVPPGGQPENSVNAENLASILRDLAEGKEVKTQACEPDSTFDFYF